MNGAIPVLPLYVFMVWTGRALSFFMYFWLQALNTMCSECRCALRVWYINLVVSIEVAV